MMCVLATPAWIACLQASTFGSIPLPIAPLFFALLVGAFALLLVFIQLGVLRYAYTRLGVSSGTALFLLFVQPVSHNDGHCLDGEIDR